MTGVHALGHPDSPLPQTKWAQPQPAHAAQPPNQMPLATPRSPKAPAAPALAQGTGCNLTVTWTAPSIDSTHGAATSYNLQFSPTGAAAWTTVTSVAAPYSLTGLTSGSAYDVRLQSANAAGASAWSAATTLGSALTAPYAPSAPVLTQATGSTLTVTWSAPAADSTHGAAAGFNLRFSPAGANTWTTVSGVTSAYTLSGLAAGSAYDAQLQSTNIAGTSAWTATTTLSTAIAVPNAPNTPSLAQGSGSNLTVAWAAPAADSTHNAASGYTLRSSPSGANSWTIVPSVATPYSLTGLTAGAAYDVQVLGANAAGNSAWSGTATLSAAAAAPYAPAAPSLAQGSGGNLTVTWTAPSADGTHSVAASYNLRFSPSGANAWTTVSSVATPYTLTGLTAGSAYDVQLQSANAAGTSAWSATTTLGTAAAVPYAPGTLSLAQGTGSTLTVTWPAPSADGTHSAAASYNLRSSPSGANTWTTIAGVTSPYSLTGLSAGAAYDVQAQSANAAGASAWSATSTATTAVAGPNTPNAPSLAQAGGGSLTVSFSAPATDSTHNAASSYSLRSSPSGANSWTTITAVTSPNTLTGLTAGAAYDVQVQSANAAGTSAWSATSTLAAGAYAPNTPAIAGVAPPPNGTTTQLAITWTAPATDGTHGAATGYNLRSSPSGAGTWTTVTGVTSPYTLTGLTGATSIDVEVQASNAAASPGAWSAITTGKTWGATVTPGAWTAAATQVHGASVAPNGGLQLFAVAAPTAVTGAAFAWSSNNSTVPTTGLVSAAGDGQTNGWGQYCNAPATAGTYYLWMLAQGSGPATIGALVTSAITVT